MGTAREFEGESLEAVLAAASAALGIAVEELQYEMIEQGRRGVFGLGARQVRIKVSSADRRPPSVPDRPKRREPAGVAAPAAPGEAPEPAGAPPDPRAFQESLERILSLMGLELRVKVSASGRSLRAVISGPDRRMLVQKDGQLLASLNFVLNRMARRKWPGASRIQVQCDGQRSGHRDDDELVELVREVASRVARTGTPEELDPMNPYERRLAHLTVREFPELDSHSAGDGFEKRITISRK
jgi:spoIIIJ-associated protein